MIPCVVQTVYLSGNRCALRWYLKPSTRFDRIVPLSCIDSQRISRIASLRLLSVLKVLPSGSDRILSSVTTKRIDSERILTRTASLVASLSLPLLV
jgi:hypothetical protein